VLLAYSSCSYSEITFEQSTNAASAGYNWVMTNILPEYAGLTVNGVVYRYTTVKATEDDMLVSVQNENALGDGYIFRSVDDWSGLPGNSINRVIPVGSIPLEAWGDGSISWTGTGDVTDATVIYSYQYDLCVDPQVDPSCAEYVAPVVALPAIEIVDPLQDEFIRLELEKKAALDDEDEEERQRLKKKDGKKKERLEVLLGSINTSLLAAQALAQAQLLLAMNNYIGAYYTTMPGGVYKETLTYGDTQLPDNNTAKRVSFAQQLLHEKMVSSQFNNLVSKP